MKQLYFICAAIIALLLMASLNPGATIDDTKETITGTVEAVNWDDDDNVTEVAIFVVVETVENEGETEDIVEYYYVDNNEGKGRELLKYEGADIEATGIVKLIENEDESYKKIIISSYKILENPD